MSLLNSLFRCLQVTHGFYCWTFWLFFHCITLFIINRFLYRTRGHIRDKVKVVLYLSNYVIKEELEHATGFDKSELAAKSTLLLWKLNLTSWTLINWLMLLFKWFFKKIRWFRCYWVKNCSYKLERLK